MFYKFKEVRHFCLFSNYLDKLLDSKSDTIDYSYQKQNKKLSILFSLNPLDFENFPVHFSPKELNDFEKEVYSIVKYPKITKGRKISNQIQNCKFS